MAELQQVLAYTVTRQGAVRLSCIVMNFCAGVSMSSSWPLSEGTSRGQFFNFTAWTGFICSILSFIIHSFQVNQRPGLQAVPWHKIETVYSVIWAFFYLVASSCVASFNSNFYGLFESWTAAAVFGFFSCILYIILSYWSWLAVRGGSDMVDHAYSVYDTGASYQDSQPGFGSRPGQDLVAQESKGPTVTITSQSNTARLELVD